jgi:hypothetical protein
VAAQPGGGQAAAVAEPGIPLKRRATTWRCLTCRRLPADCAGLAQVACASAKRPMVLLRPTYLSCLPALVQGGRDVRWVRLCRSDVPPGAAAGPT